MELTIMTSDYDVSITDMELLLHEDDAAWFKEQIGLSEEDWYRIFARAQEIVQELTVAGFLMSTGDEHPAASRRPGPSRN
jgi:uncharacterized protein YneR